METRRTLLHDRYLVTHNVDPADHGCRLDSFLRKHYRSRTRQVLQAAIESGAITIVRRNLMTGKIKASTQLLTGDEVQVLSVRKPEPWADFNYKILYQDQDIAVIDKPACLPVHPAGRYFFNTLLIHLRTEGFTQPLKAEREYFLVHRIDRETSGVMVLTRRAEVCGDLVDQFANRKTQKKYLALVHGSPQLDAFQSETPMGRKANSRIRVQMQPMSVDEGGQVALTSFKVVERFKRFSLIECQPKTGRQHQIRAHLFWAGYPIVGDKLYGLSESDALQFFESPHTKTRSGIEILEEGDEHFGRSLKDRSNPEGPGFLPPRMISPELQHRLMHYRHALHAAEISFRHPVSKKEMCFQSPLPEDLRDFISRCDDLKRQNLDPPSYQIPRKPLLGDFLEERFGPA